MHDDIGTHKGDSTISFTVIYLHWKMIVVMMPTLSSLVAPPCHQGRRSWHQDFSNFSLVLHNVQATCIASHSAIIEQISAPPPGMSPLGIIICYICWFTLVLDMCLCPCQMSMLCVTCKQYSEKRRKFTQGDIGLVIPWHKVHLLSPYHHGVWYVA